MDTPAINDLSISIATENGTGSASANNILFKAIFKMGIPCSSKNMFPSNIQGLPTWYQIRASAEGYMARKDVIDVMVMFNDATAESLSMTTRLRSAPISSATACSISAFPPTN